MTSRDAERQRKLNDDFDNVFREHERLRKDLNVKDNHQYRTLLQTIDQWEQDSIKKIEKAAKTARSDVQKLVKTTHEHLQIVLHDSVTEKLQETLKQKLEITEYDIDQWLISLSEIRKQLENLSVTVEFSHDNVIKLIKVKRQAPTRGSKRSSSNTKPFYFEKARGNPIFYKTQGLIITNHPAIVVSQNIFSKGAHYFRFRVEKSTDELFFGVISESEYPHLKNNLVPLKTIYGWWNIDRRVLHGRKEPYVSTLHINDGDEIILTLNCEAQEIFLEYPSMWKLNSIKVAEKEFDCPKPWRLLIEIGKPGECVLRLLDWGVLAHWKDIEEKNAHCYCLTD